MLPPIAEFDFACFRSNPPLGCTVMQADKTQLRIQKGPVEFCVVKRRDGEFYMHRCNLKLGELDLITDRDFVMRGSLFGCLSGLGYAQKPSEIPKIPIDIKF